MEIQVGKEVVCINAKGVEYTGLKEGVVYRVKAMMEGCCCVFVDVGLKDSLHCEKVVCCFLCGANKKHDNKEWKAIWRFAPLADISELEEILKEQPNIITK